MTLAAQDLWFSYGDRPVLKGISLSVEPGEWVALAAPSGFGKTTLCRVLAGYLTPDRGSVEVDGDPLPHRGTRPVQMIGQHPERMLDPRLRMRDSLAEGTRAGCRMGEGSLCADGNSDGFAQEALLEALGIRSQWMARFPHELSGGEMQRFCIARALLARPRYLICDEISTMLDAVTQARIWEVVQQEAHARQLGVVLVTHSLPLAERLASRCVSLA